MMLCICRIFALYWYAVYTIVHDKVSLFILFFLWFYFKHDIELELRSDIYSELFALNQEMVLIGFEEVQVAKPNAVSYVMSYDHDCPSMLNFESKQSRCFVYGLPHKVDTENYPFL